MEDFRSSNAKHIANRKKVCIGCGCKCLPNTRHIKNDNIDPKVIHLVKTYLKPDYDTNDLRYPVGICLKCRLVLQKKDKNQEVILPKMPNFEDIILPKSTRANDTPTCYCFICLTGSNKGKQSKGGRGFEKEEVKITNTNGKYASNSNNKLDSPITTPTKEKRSSLTLCSKCNQSIGKGIKHPENCSVASASKNIASHILENMPEKQQEQVATAIIHNKAEEISTSKQNVNITLATKGKQTRICLNPKVYKPAYFSEQSLNDLQSYIGVSNSSMKKIMHYIRVHQGRKALPPYMRSNISAAGRSMDDLYKVEWVEMDIEKGKKDMRPVFYGNATEILEHVCEARDIAGPCFVKVLADSGQGSFKISLIVLPHAKDDQDIDDSDENGTTSSRTTYAEGGSFSNHLKMSGVKRSIMLVNVPDIKETWDNCKVLWDLAKINDIPYLFSGDFKLTLILLGLQTATSSYPCHLCFVSLDQLRGLKEFLDNLKSNDNFEHNETSENDDKSGSDDGSLSSMTTSDEVFNTIQKERTFGDLRKDYERFKALGGDKAKARLCNSTINPCIFQEDDLVRIIDKTPLPELHLLLGFLNHLFWDKYGLVYTIGRDKAMKWAIKANAVSVGYHGEVFEGPACRRLLKAADYLLSSEFLSDIPNPLLVIPLATTFQAMNKLVESCFGVGKVKGDVAQLLENLIVHYMALDSSVTLKVHVLFEHLIPGLANLGGHGMGLTSEQAGESIHHEFANNYWSKYKINMISNPQFAINWFKANVEFSSKHK